MNEVIEKEIELLKKTEIIKQIKAKDYFLGEFLGYPKQKTKLGQIPTNWKLEKLANISWYQEGPGLRNWQFKKEGIKVINVTNLVEGYLDLSKTDRHVDWMEFNDKYKHFECRKRDIVIASSGNTYCKHAIIREQDLPLMMNTSVIRFQPLDGVNYDFLNQFLKSTFFKQQIDILITGAAQPNFGPYHLEKILVPYPNNTDLQNIIGETLEIIDKKIIEIRSKIKISKSLQKSLINQVF